MDRSTSQKNVLGSPDPKSQRNLLRLSPKRSIQSKLQREKNSFAGPSRSDEKGKNFNGTNDALTLNAGSTIQKPSKEFEAKYKHNSFIIQKYIERPLLIDQRKFDIRVWVFLDSKGNAYICKPGYLRTSSYKFELDPDDPDNRFVHLTNIAV